MKNPENLETCLNSIKIAAERIWKSPKLIHYTNHDVNHSEIIIELLDKILEKTPNLLNEHERFVLHASAYLHDIGMQSARHAGLPEKSQYTLEDMEIIRAKHHESSEKMILESVQPTKKISLGLEQCKDYASFIAILAKSHCGKVEINSIEDGSIGGEDIRLKLLTALLKLADELDRDYRRVNIQDLKLWGIPVESKFYWWTHHYTQSIGIKNGRIKLYFRFPEEYRGKDTEEVFIKKTEESIRGQLEEVYDILWDKGVKLTLDTKIEKTYVPEGIVEVIPDNLFGYIEENILKPLLKPGIEKTVFMYYFSTARHPPDQTKPERHITALAGKRIADQKACEWEKNASLVNVLLADFSARDLSDGRLSNPSLEIDKTTRWIYVYRYKDRILKVFVSGDKVESKEYNRNEGKQDCYFQLPVIKNWDIDSDEAISIAVKNRAILRYGVILACSAFDISMKDIEGDFTPIWTTYFRLGTISEYKLTPFVINALTGRNIYIAGDEEHWIWEHSNLLQRKYPDDDIINSSRLVKKSPESVLTDKGIEFTESGEYENAIKCFDEAIQVNRNFVHAWNNKGIVLGLLNKLNEAIECHERATLINPDFKEAWSYKGVAFRKLGEYKKAIECFNKAIDIGPNYKDAMVSKGNVLVEIGELSEAIEWYEGAIDIDPEDKTAWNGKGIVFKRLREYEKAIEFFEKALRIDPNFKEAMYNLKNTLGMKGENFLNSGKPDAAIECFKRIVEIDRDDKYTWNNLGVAFAKSGRYDKAIQCFDKSIEIDPNFKHGWNNKGNALKSLGHNEDAEKCFQKARELGHSSVGGGVSSCIE